MVIIVEKMNMKLCKCWQSYVDAINVIIERFGNSMENAIIDLVDRLKYAFLILFCKFNDLTQCVNSKFKANFCFPSFFVLSFIGAS